jgi:hypothetical protein
VFDVSSSAAGSSDPLAPLPLAGVASREVRAALRPEFRDQFDRDRGRRHFTYFMYMTYSMYI